jgi:1,4-dihydroxy-2-naphthoate octaprenyltransferase
LMRPQFLIAGLFLNILGIAAATYLGATIDLWKALVFQLVVWSLQMAGASANEYADVETDGLNVCRTWFSGGSGVISSGALGRGVAMAFAVLWGIVALASSVLLSVAMGVTYVISGLTVIGLVLALSYSLRPLKFSYIGLGELSMGVMVSILVPLASFIVQTDRVDRTVLVASVPIFFQILALLMVTEYPDFEADTRVGKRTLVVRLGRLTSWRLGILLLIVAASSAFFGGLFGIPGVAALVAGVFLLMEALFFFIAEKYLISRAIMFWSTAVSCGFYVLVIAVLAFGLAAT